MEEHLTDLFIQLFCEKNSNETKTLSLKGKYLHEKTGGRLIWKDMKKIARFLDNNRNIIKLDVCHNNIGDEGIKILVNEYLSCEDNTLQSLNLTSCNITGKGIKALCSTAKTLHLKTLRLNGNKLGFSGGREVVDLLEKCPTIKHFDIGDTAQTLKIADYLASAITHYDKKSQLEILDFSVIVPDGKTRHYDPAYLAEILGKMIRVNTSVVELHLQKNEFDGHDIELLLWGLDKNNTLLLLDLGFNRIGNHGAEVIAKWLKTKPPLLGLNISGNSIRDAGARVLSFGLPYSKVKLLDITYNRIGSIGMRSILQYIRKPYLLKFFYFWGNNFNQATCKIIKRKLQDGVLLQKQIDVKLYTVNDVLYAAYYPTNHCKHRYYCLMDHGCSDIELRSYNTEYVGFSKTKSSCETLP